MDRTAVLIIEKDTAPGVTEPWADRRDAPHLPGGPVANHNPVPTLEQMRDPVSVDTDVRRDAFPITRCHIARMPVTRGLTLTTRADGSVERRLSLH